MDGEETQNSSRSGLLPDPGPPSGRLISCHYRPKVTNSQCRARGCVKGPCPGAAYVPTSSDPLTNLKDHMPGLGDRKLKTKDF